MIAIILSLLLIVAVIILGLYTSIMKQEQIKFIISSSVLYIIFFGVAMSMLTSNKGIVEMLTDNNTYIPLIFYILWYVSSASISNLFTGKNDYTGFFENTHPYMSKRNLMPR